MFALISGYVGVGRRHRYRSLVGYWLQMVFVTVSLTALFSMIYGQDYFTFKRVFLTMVFPITCHANWYMTSYFMLFIFMPLLDQGILSLSKVQYRNVILGAIGLISLARFVSLADPFKVNSGFSFFWLMILYVIGAYFKLHPVSIKKRWCAVGMLASLLVTYGVSFLFRKNVVLTNLYHGNPFLGGYVSPFILAFAIFALLLISQYETLPDGLWRVVHFLAPTCLGVFLWHINEFSMSVLRTLGRLFNHSDGVVYSLVLYCTLSLGIFFVFSVVEHGRMLLFRVLGIERWVKGVGKQG